MLQDIRDKSQGWIAKTLIAAIGVLLMLTGYETFFRSSRTEDQIAAKVNGEKIGVSQLNAVLNAQRQRMAQELGPQFDPSVFDDPQWKDKALEGLIQQILLLQGAKKSGLGVTDRDINQRIAQAVEFQVDGKFNPQRYVLMVRQLGYDNPQQFVEQLKKNLTLAQLRATVAGTDFATDGELKALADLQGQTRDLAIRTLSSSKDGIQVGEDEIKQYYQNNTPRFSVPEQVVVEYLELKKQDFSEQVQVSEQALRDLYDQEITAPPERRRAAHILIPLRDQQNAQQAKAKIDAIQKRLEKGEDFAQLAKETSEDAGSAAQGGDLGYAGRDDYDPAFANALYALKPGEVSPPVQTLFGWHLIKLLAVAPGEKPSFDSVKARLAEELKSRQAQAKFLDASRALENSAFESSDLAQPAQELHLSIQTSQPFNRQGGSGVAANPKVVSAAFSEEVLQDGNNSSLIEPDEDTAVILRVKEHLEPKQKPLEAVSEEIRRLLTQKKLQQANQAEGEKLIAALRAGQETATGDAWRTVKGATRQQTDLEPAIIRRAFSIPHPQDNQPTYAGVSLNNGNYAVIRLERVDAPAEPLSKEAADKLRDQLAAHYGQQDFLAYYQQLRERAKIEKK